ncbi:Restriction endonuclease, McrA/HNH family [Natranaeroarchaeum sulfidigenes]|uniref:Restriction endonuclease, McrA/HNH family n=1 Tax=Natranaeroarchaeum sulfidigenes TaxID=2784880 RepID=A0A897MPF2_9EURY|nr:Restriction endonuclease, McrA/HNH family [Natranaeroarchaeum sulfidigenes]
MECPSCEKELSTEHGMRQHHTKVHGKPLANRECNGCGSKFYDSKSRKDYCVNCNPNAGPHNGNWKGGMTETNCIECGSDFLFYPSNKQGLYCSSCIESAEGLLPDDCLPSANKISTYCRWCGALLKRHPSDLKDTTRGPFCNLECYGNWLSDNIIGKNHHQWRGGEIYYGQSWWEMRRIALERDNHECSNCGKSPDDLGQNPDVHHLKPVREFEDPGEAHSLTRKPNYSLP